MHSHFHAKYKGNVALRRIPREVNMDDVKQTLHYREFERLSTSRLYTLDEVCQMNDDNRGNASSSTSDWIEQSYTSNGTTVSRYILTRPARYPINRYIHCYIPGLLPEGLTDEAGIAAFNERLRVHHMRVPHSGMIPVHNEPPITRVPDLQPVMASPRLQPQVADLHQQMIDLQPQVADLHIDDLIRENDGSVSPPFPDIVSRGRAYSA